MPDMSTKHNTYVVDQKLKRFDDVSFREHFGRIICFQTKICPFLRQGWGHSFLWNKVEVILLIYLVILTGDYRLFF